MNSLMGIILQKGDRGDDVKKLQQLLINKGCPLPLYGVDGIYGSETVSAVECFQAKMALPVTGVVDDVTWARLQGISGSSKKWIWWLIILLGGAGWYLFKGGKKGKKGKRRKK